MLAARPYRDRFRRALGVRQGQRLVVLNSTWNPEGFFGDGGGQDVLPSLLPRLTAELPADDYRLAAVLHPNIWHGHGPGQIRAWLDRARRSGLTLIDPDLGWRQALLAADLVIGDFGAVTYYAAALDVPVLLAAADQDRLDPDAPLATFVRNAPRLDPHAPLRPQVESTHHTHSPHPADFVTSAPGASAPLLRKHFYALLDLPEPTTPALLEPLPLPPYDPPHRTAPLHVLTRVQGTDITLQRSTVQPYDADGDAHLAVHEDTRNPGDLESADLIVRDGAPDDPRLGSPVAWTAEVLRRHAHCSAAAYVSGPDTCTLRTRSHGLFELSAGPDADLDPAAYASALYAWLTSHKTPAPDDRPTTLTVHAAQGPHSVTVSRPPRTADADSPGSSGAGWPPG
ncbi:hypothetical protein [Streptomyces sp. NPDC046821]|uniref:hypothetical protein n=1 Tax=Streptomyces sp. NPDC046821 TaxID=3154702 RepID=UPI00340FE1EF